MTITEFLLARIAEDALEAKVCLAGYENTTARRWIHVLAECAAKRAIIEEVSKWGHRYNDDDIWYSCGLATSWDDDEPGSGCSDESARGRCTCGLELRQLRILGPLAAVYAYDTDYRQEWALS